MESNGAVRQIISVGKHAAGVEVGVREAEQHPAYSTCSGLGDNAYPTMDAAEV